MNERPQWPWLDKLNTGNQMSFLRRVNWTIFCGHSLRCHMMPSTNMDPPLRGLTTPQSPWTCKAVISKDQRKLTKSPTSWAYQLSLHADFLILLMNCIAKITYSISNIYKYNNKLSSKVFCMQCKILIKLYFSDKFDNIRYNVKYQLSFVF